MEGMKEGGRNGERKAGRGDDMGERGVDEREGELLIRRRERREGEEERANHRFFFFSQVIHLKRSPRAAGCHLPIFQSPIQVAEVDAVGGVVQISLFGSEFVEKSVDSFSASSTTLFATSSATLPSFAATHLKQI